ncbi:hypothetical protein BGZ74_010965 [Mortierella antarctica]|nr:hypothetical protein BGZ74_010965 [Mortierella antarctica]
MTIVSTNTLTSHTDTVLTVRCATLKGLEDNVTLTDSDSASTGSKWKCTLMSRRPLLRISVSTCDPLKADRVKVMRIRSVQGKKLARTNVKVSENVSSATMKDLFQLASKYEVDEVREYCRDKILASITVSNALKILFEYAYRYLDLKYAIVKYVADYMDELLLTGQDPFGAYGNHAQCQSILDAVLKMTLEA